MAPICVIACAASVALAQDTRPPLPTPKARLELKKRVDAAAAKAVEWVKSRQASDGSFQKVRFLDTDFNDGPTALAMLALLVSGVYRGEECIARSFERILGHDVEHVYEAGIAAMALEAKATPPDELRARGDGQSRSPGPRILLPGEREWLERTMHWLRHNRGGAAWSYPGLTARQADNSNTQYALLGLKAAARCGVKVDKEVWLNALQYFLRAQEEMGPRVTFVRTEGMGTGARVARYYDSYADARGWGYTGKTAAGRAYGSMTCVGIASLLLCDSELRGFAGYTPKISADVPRAVRDGIAWLQENYAIETHPNKGKLYHHYYLYALERAGVLSNTDYIGGHDWYHEGASYLCDTQKPDGQWVSKGGTGGSLVETCFALLFLKRSTVPLGLTTPSVK